jgi:hypothetical protein
VWAVAARPPVVAGSLLAFALVAGVLITAPEKSAAERAVERGQALIAAQLPTAPVVTAANTTTHRGRPQEGDGPADAGEPAWPRNLAVPPGEAMSGFGDSVLSGAAPAMFERFPGVALDATPNRQWPDAPGLIRAALDAGTLRPVVVLQFGTNAGLNSEASKAALREVLELLGSDRRVVLVNTVGVSNWVPETNAVLAAIAAEHDHVVVADWHGTVSGAPHVLHSDRTHPNMEGIAVYADLVATSLDALGPG